MADDRKHDYVEIIRTANGYIIRPYTASQVRGDMRPMSEAFTFESYDSMDRWLRSNLEGASSAMKKR